MMMEAQISPHVRITGVIGGNVTIRWGMGSRWYVPVHVPVRIEHLRRWLRHIPDQNRKIILFAQDFLERIELKDGGRCFNVRG